MNTIAIGTPVLDHYLNEGYVSRVVPAADQVFTLGSGTMRRIHNNLEIVFDSRVSEVPDNIAAPWLARAAEARLDPIRPEDVDARRARALAAQEESRETARRERLAMENRAAEFLEEAKARTPAWAQAVIVGELVEDESDSMTDYFNSRSKRKIILGFSKHKRDLFPELRKAALNHPDTAFLHDAPETAEHREKWSMGGGYYLKDGYRHNNGWKVSKYCLYDGAKDVPVGEWSLTPPAAVKAPRATPAAPVGAFTIEKHRHTKHGFDMWIVVLADRVERDVFDTLRDNAKAAGGWYSRAWGSTPGGFAFKSDEAANAFAQNTTQEENHVAPAPIGNVSTAAKMRATADKLQSEIDNKLGDRLANTPKRQREAAVARQEGARLERTQQALRALADLHDRGAVPPELASVTTKAAVYALCASHIDRSNAGHYDAGFDTGKPSKDTPAAHALWALLSPESEDDKRAAEIRAKTEKLQFAKIPGYFPTPSAIVARMIEAAEIPLGGCTVLEPSAGSGAILDVVRNYEPECCFVVYERHYSLREILTLKRYVITGEDFTDSSPELRVDRVLMNPPFENGQDAEHVRRAFGHLNKHGRLVSIMSPGPFFRNDSKSQAFRAWFESVGGKREPLPSGSFKESGTGIETLLVTIDA